MSKIADRRDSQLTDTVVMVSPYQFGFNHQTADTNVFQNNRRSLKQTAKQMQNAALSEFNRMVAILQSHGINVLILPSRKDVIAPDSIFPNNWFSHHQNGVLILYPLFTPNRRAERQTNALLRLLTTTKIQVHKIIDFTQEEERGRMLEGTGSLVLDRIHKVAFAASSLRTSKAVLNKWCKKMNFYPMFFHAYDEKNFPIYHTNVMMSIGDKFVIICLEAIKNSRERKMISNKLVELKKELIPITLEQLYSFCGNILHLKSQKGDKKIVLSQTAMNAFTTRQKEKLRKYGELVPVNISTIENIGGGSTRCMLAEVFPTATFSQELQYQEGISHF